MSKPYTEADFSAQITDDRNWRIKEISDLKSAIRRGDANLRKVLLRALITLSYAHWEGYVKFAAKKYLDYVALRKYAYGNLNKQFLRNLFLPRLGAMYNARINVAERVLLIDEILNSADQRFSQVDEDLVNTKANLNFEVFSEICIICDVPLQFFAEKSTFIDVVLLKRRNAIAHGENTLIGLDDLDAICEETISLMRAFGDALENHVVLQTYKAG
ncbi:MAE_28990/MAE_18760 family HEPN-like nuclease [Pseudomonas guariconensis]|uniref:MAE_28990/MAE_18760 family HEPN-like nuclease n=1 Tax=Pseudomonas guariconensis TaxID=1288410 RepID=UPI002FE69322